MNRYENIWKLMARPCLAFHFTEEGIRYIGIDADGGGLIHTTDICDAILFNDEDDVRLVDRTAGIMHLDRYMETYTTTNYDEAVTEIKRLYGQELNGVWFRKSNAGDSEAETKKPVSVPSRAEFVCFYRLMIPNREPDLLDGVMIDTEVAIDFISTTDGRLLFSYPNYEVTAEIASAYFERYPEEFASN